MLQYLLFGIETFISGESHRNYLGRIKGNQSSFFMNMIKIEFT